MSLGNSKFRTNSFFWAAFLISSILFAIDSHTPFESSSSIPYMLVVLIGLRSTRKRNCAIYAALPSFFVILGGISASATHPLNEIIAGRSLTIFVIWLTATVLAIYKSMQQKARLKNFVILKQSKHIQKQTDDLDMIFNSVPAMIWYKDKHNRIIRANKPAAESMGLTVEEVSNKATTDLYPIDAEKYHKDDLEVIQSRKPKFNIIEPYHKKGGERCWVCTDKIPNINAAGEVIGVIVFSTDITARRKAEELQLKQRWQLSKANEELTRLSIQDYLTGLKNRRGLDKAICKIVAELKPGSKKAFALLLDLDNFKQVNHTFGYVMGDIVIKRVGEKLREMLDEKFIIGRIGGDEFMILLSQVSDDEALNIAERLRLDVSKMVVGMSAGKAINVTTCIGMVSIQAHSTSLEELIERSYFALNQGKKVGKNTVVYRDKVGVAQNDAGQVLSSMLRDDNTDNLFFVVQQEILSLKDRKVHGYELLSRLNDEHYGMPRDFFRLAMESRVLTFIDRLCLKTCVNASRLVADNTIVHVNLFPSTLIEVPTQQIIDEIQSGKNSKQFCIEISEQQIIGEPTHLIKSVRKLRQAGIKIALDDIGFGSSCLESLILLEPQTVKIDQKCVRGLAISSEMRNACKRLIDVIHSCGAVIIAEGIESEEDLAVLVDLGVIYGQGYLFSQPIKLVESIVQL